MDAKTGSFKSYTKEECEDFFRKLNLCARCAAKLSEICGFPLAGNPTAGVCVVCGGIRDSYHKILGELDSLLAGFGGDWGTFRVDVVVERPRGLDEDSRLLFESLKDDFKREFKREVGAHVERLGKRFDPLNPDIIILHTKSGFHIRRPNIYLEGRYLKLFRNISQAKWVCNNCGGGGCVECNYRGRHFMGSVEEFITVPLQALFHAERIVFHAGGREDVDVLVLGGGRPFIVEIENPAVKVSDLDVIERAVNAYSEGIVSVRLEKFSTLGRVEELKRASETSLKRYEGLIRFYGKVNVEDLEKASRELSGIVIEQRTPWRVKRRRADRLRHKRVESFSMTPIDDHTAHFTIVCQGGTYVKEFISGDDGRTNPSVSQILGIRCKCVELNLVGVEMKND